MLDQQQQEQEQQEVGQEVQLPGVSTMLDETEQVAPRCSLKRSIKAVWDGASVESVMVGLLSHARQRHDPGRPDAKP